MTGRSLLVALTLVTTAALSPAAPTRAATQYTGDTIDGVKVISQLDVSDLEPGKKHRFLFQGVEMATGQHWYVPVMVAKGANPGKKVLISAGVHGDELSPTDVVQRAFAELDPAKMSGTVLAVLDIGRAAMEQIRRKWPTPVWGGTLFDLNRVWPGREDGNVAQRQGWLVWNRLFKGNIDAALDFHTGATGTDFAMFIFADLRQPENRSLAELFPVAQIKDDPGYPGTLETAFVEAGIPAITPEVGGGRSFDRPKIAISVEGVRNVLAHYGVTQAKVGKTSVESGAFIGNDIEAIRAARGGFVETTVTVGEKVSAGQTVAVQRNSFGDVVQEYKAGVDGVVAILTTDALLEPGSRIVEILTRSEKCEREGCPYDESED